MTHFYTFLAGGLIMFASLVGVLFTGKTLGTWLSSRLRYLIALASGVFSITVYRLVEEAFHEGALQYILIAFTLGALFLKLTTLLLPTDAHHHHVDDCGHSHSPIDARRVLVSDGLHNIHDGIALVPAFILSPAIGFGTAFGIFLHECVQEISEYFILREAGYSNKKALLSNFAASGTLLIGITLSLYLVSIETVAPYLVAFSAGSFSYVLFADLLPSVYRHARTEKRYTYFTLSFLAGCLIMGTVTVLLPHEERSEEEFLLPEGFGIAYQNNFDWDIFV